MAESQMSIYLFAQALDNKSADDYFCYTNGEVRAIESKDDKNFVQKMLAETTGEGKFKEIGSIKGYWQWTNHFKNVVLLISHGQKDHIERDSRTALILQNFQKNSLSDEKIGEILNSFWQQTGRNQIVIHPIEIIRNIDSHRDTLFLLGQILDDIRNIIEQLKQLIKGSSSHNKKNGEHHDS